MHPAEKHHDRGTQEGREAPGHEKYQRGAKETQGYGVQVDPKRTVGRIKWTSKTHENEGEIAPRVIHSRIGGSLSSMGVVVHRFLTMSVFILHPS